MNRTGINIVVDLTAAGLFLGMMATGYILGFTLPAGTNKMWSLWGLTRHQWGNIHLWISFGFLAVVLLHFCMHWQWVVAVVRKRLHQRTCPQGGLLRSGLATLLVVAALLGLFAWTTQTSVQEITDSAGFGVCPPSGGNVDNAADVRDNSPSAVKKGERPTVEFWKDVYPLLEKACLSCHGPNRQRGGFRVDRREDFFGTDGKAALVVPGNSAQSPLIAIVSGHNKDMPRPDVHRLPTKDTVLLKAWIDAGAEWPERPRGNAN
jgi:hypothetical protein